MVLVVHAAMSKLGWTNGGAVAVIQALQDVLTPSGTLVMPAHPPRKWIPAFAGMTVERRGI